MSFFGMSGRKATSTVTKKATKAEVNVQALEKLFAELADPDDPDVISMEGIGKLCELLGVDASTDVRSLILVWKLKAVAKPGQITKEEFLEGFRALAVSDIKGLQGLLPTFDPGFLERSAFREFYRFVFQFSREGTHKTLERDLVVGLLPIVLNENRAPHLEHFIAFLQQCKHSHITLDQWDSFLQFNQNVRVDLSNWEDDGAWPLLLDEYVDWRRKST